MIAKSRVPEIRFKGFSGEWKEKKLGDICIIGDIDHKMPETVKNGIPYLMTGDFIENNGLDCICRSIRTPLPFEFGQFKMRYFL